MEQKPDNDYDEKIGPMQCTARISIGFFAFLGLMAVGAVIFLLFAGI